MAAGKMHDNEVETSVSLVRRLLGAQFPQWADLEIERVYSAGTDNVIYRLGEDMAVRMPRIPSAVEQVEKEQHWLPKLGPLLPLDIPLPLAKGVPESGYPWHWSVYRWLEGENATIERIADPGQAARKLAEFIMALQQIASMDGPRPGAHNAYRGVPLAARDGQTRAAIERLNGKVDREALVAAWAAALAAPAWDGPPVWIHGDLLPGNLLALDGRLSGIIDFGCLGVGDPACDLLAAWTVFFRETRDIFQEALEVDEASWSRGRGWALSFGVIALPYYKHTNPILAKIAEFAIDQVVADHQRAII